MRGDDGISDMKVTQQRQCRFCGDQAGFSLAFLLSTLGRSPRKQQCSPAVPLCDSCMRLLYESDALGDVEELQGALKQAYTAVNRQADAPADTKTNAKARI